MLALYWVNLPVYIKGVHLQVYMFELENVQVTHTVSYSVSLALAAGTMRLAV